MACMCESLVILFTPYSWAKRNWRLSPTVITMLEQSQAKLIMWVQWYFYWITFSRHRQRPSNPPHPTLFSPSINNLLEKDAWLLQAQVRMTLRVQHWQWTRSRCTTGRGKALLRWFAFLRHQLIWQTLLYSTLSYCSSETMSGKEMEREICVMARKHQSHYVSEQEKEDIFWVMQFVIVSFVWLQPAWYFPVLSLQSKPWQINK